MVAGIALSLVLFVSLLAGVEIGRRFRLRRAITDDPLGTTNSIDGVVYAVLGLLFAFTFASAASTFSQRRQLIADQANALQTAYVRADLLPAGDREAVRAPMRQWLKAALEMAPLSDDRDEQYAVLRHQAEDLQNQAWHAAIEGLRHLNSPSVDGVVLAPVNDWMGYSTTRASMSTRGPPPMVMPTLFILSIVSAILAGSGMAKHVSRRRLHTSLFAGVIAFSFYVIIDLEHPRSGLIRVDSSDVTMRELDESLSHTPTTPATTP